MRLSSFTVLNHHRKALGRVKKKKLNVLRLFLCDEFSACKVVLYLVFIVVQPVHSVSVVFECSAVHCMAIRFDFKMGGNEAEFTAHNRTLLSSE